MAQHKFFNQLPPAMGVLFMDKIREFKLLLNNISRAYKIKRHLNDNDLGNVFKWLNVQRFQRYKGNNEMKFPNLLELKEIELIFDTDLKEYYPTQCDKAQAFIIKRLMNKINRKNVGELIGMKVNFFDIQYIENNDYVNYSEKRKEIYSKFMDLKIN